ncbi:MAG: hypothetical protein H6Q01_1117, partial [Acidobacteria bacterium]|nr:hypothetical protein [Acidobacteriota bacterium]
ARAFGIACAAAFVGTVIFVLLAPFGTEPLRAPGLLATLILYFAWRRASDRKKERDGGGTSNRPVDQAI